MLETIKQYLQIYQGNLLEIGVGHGVTTEKLANFGLEFNRQVLAIDPFEEGWEYMPDTYGKPYPYSIFKQRILDKYDNVQLLKYLSNSPKVVPLLQKNSPICFAFIDGLQFKKSVLQDLVLMESLNVPVLCLDDYTRSTTYSQVPLAVDEFLQQKTYKKVKVTRHFENNKDVVFLEKI